MIFAYQVARAKVGGPQNIGSSAAMISLSGWDRYPYPSRPVKGNSKLRDWQTPCMNMGLGLCAIYLSDVYLSILMQYLGFHIIPRQMESIAEWQNLDDDELT